jgi:transposase
MEQLFLRLQTLVFPQNRLRPDLSCATLHAEIGGLTLENNFCPARSARRVFCRAQKND